MKLAQAALIHWVTNPSQVGKSPETAP